MGRFGTVKELEKGKRLAENNLKSSQDALHRAIEAKCKFTYELGQRMMSHVGMGDAIKNFKRDHVLNDEGYAEILASTSELLLTIRVFPFREGDLFTVCLKRRSTEIGMPINIALIESIGRVIKQIIEQIEI